jgi:hypothetical protein
MEPRESRSPRRVVVSYGSYEEAQRAVDYLSDEGFPVERVSIVAEDLRFVEQVTGRRGYGQAALEGAGSGAVVGAFFGFFLGLFNIFDPVVSALVLAIYGLVFGAIVGAIIGLISHALAGGRRDFSSVGGMEAGRYNVMADEEVAEEASRLLAGLQTSPQAPSGDVRRETAPEPPRTGEAPPPPGEERPERRTP